MKYSHDLLDGRFDRSYEYDHTARLTKALSGAEARGEPATTDRPYTETATYDAFDHLNTRFSKHWSRLLGFSSSDTYSNNRRVGWTYDAEGNLLSDAGRQYTFDAAGRTSSTSWTTGYFNDFRDGDGRRVKATQPNLVTYYLRSTVLGGQVIEELNSSGAKQRGFIYIGQKIAGYDWANGNVSLLHEDPSGTTVHSSLPETAFVADFTDLDPWGAEVFSWDPYLDDPQFSGGRGESGPTYSGYGDISMPSTGCMLDGAYTLCEFLRNSESLAFQVTVGGKSKQFPIAPGLLGIFAVWVEDAGKKLTKPQTPNGAEVEEGDTIVTNTDRDGLGHWELVNLAFPQNTLPLPSDLRDRVSAIVANPKGDCADYIKKLLDQVSTNYGKAFSTDALDLFDRVGQAGFQLKKIKYTREADFVGNRRVVYITPGTLSGGEGERVLEHSRNGYAVTALNELMHHARNSGVYTDRMLAEAAFKLLTPDERLQHPLPKSKDVITNSKYFHPLFNLHCRSVTGE